MEYKIVRLSTNRFKINGVIYKRVKSKRDCNGCYFFDITCKLRVFGECIKNGKYYHLKPNEI